MSLEGLLLSLLTLILSIIWVGYPLISKSLVTETTINNKEHDRLLTLYSQVMSTIRDMDEDYAAGKLQQHEYDQERKVWAERGVNVLKSLEQFEDIPSAVASDSIDDVIEAAVANYRRQ